MGSFSCADTLGDISCGLSVCGLSCEKPHLENEEYSCWNNEESSKVTLPAIPSVPSISEKDVLTDREADDASALFLPVNDLQGQLSDSNAASDEKPFETTDAEAYQELDGSAPLDMKNKKALAKSASFPSSVEVVAADLSASCCTAFQDQCSFTSNNSTYARSLSLPVPSKLISAMKGSRAQNASPSNTKLHVKWAAEVYDPPCTLMSHTVKKSHHQRPKAKKKDNKHKHKGKSTRRSNTERQNANKSGVSNAAKSVDRRPQTSEDSLLPNGYGKSSMEVLEYTVSSQDSKCGSSFLREALAKVHISIAEAT